MQKQKRILPVVGAAAALALSLAAAPRLTVAYTPGSRTIVLSHNAFPDHGRFANRLDRAIAAGVPFAVEQDLAWVDGHSFLIHGPKAASANDPTLESYFLPKIAPIMEKALKDGNKGNWPLVVLYLDIKNDPPEHLEAVSKLLDKFNPWLTTAEKTSDITRQMPLDVKPMMILLEDKQDDVKQAFFYDRVPVGGRIRAFGSATKFDENPKKMPREKKDEAVADLVNYDPEQLVSSKADNYHRWFGTNWAFVEEGGQTKAGEWTKATEARLKKFVDYGHRLGYFVGVYCLNGYTAAEDQGWDKGYNFGSKEKVMPRWQAAVRAHADFISTDQPEDVSRVIKAGR